VTITREAPNYSA